MCWGFFCLFVYGIGRQRQSVREREIIKNGGGNETGLEVKDKRTAEGTEEALEVGVWEMSY